MMMMMMMMMIDELRRGRYIPPDDYITITDGHRLTDGQLTVAIPCFILCRLHRAVKIGAPMSSVRYIICTLQLIIIFIVYSADK